MDSFKIFYNSDILLNDWLKSWDKFGKTNFLNSAKKKDVDGVIDSLYQLVLEILTGNGKPEYYNSVLAELVKNFEGTKFESRVADMLWMLDIVSESEDDQKEKLSKIIQYSKTHICEAFLKERLSDDTLEKLRIIPSKQQFQSRFVKTKTRLFYKQQKFNLLREENEGYAKLITALIQFECASPEFIDHIKSLIGYFDLDPNRVLDILLDAFECRPQLQDEFVKVIRAYAPDVTDITHMMGRKFQFLNDYKDCDPRSLYGATVRLIIEKLVDLNTLYSYLTPCDKSINEYQLAELEEAKSRKSSVQSSDPEKKDSKEEEDKLAAERRSAHYQTNQKLGVCEALLECGDWEQASQLLNHFPEYYATSFQPLAKLICNLIHHAIDPMYRKVTFLATCIHNHGMKVFGKFSFPQCHSWSDLTRRIFPIAMKLGANLSYDNVLIAKLCRLGKFYLSQRENTESIDTTYQGFFNLLDESILPAMSLIDCNCCMAEEVWELLKLMPYHHRYRLYGQWKNSPLVNHPRIISKKSDILSRIKYIMKRLSHENVKLFGRQIGGLTHSNPGVVFEYVISNILMYDNLVGPVVDSFKYLNSLSFDFLSYCLIEALSNPHKEKISELQLSSWFQTLSNFTGLLCKKYTFDLSALFQYVLNQLKDGKSYDLLLVSDILHKMTGIEQGEEMTNDQLEACMGGELLRQEGAYFSQLRNTRRNTSRLKDSLMQQRLALPLVLMMARQREAIIFLEDPDRHVKMSGRLYDQCQDTLTQLMTFLSLQLSTDEFVKQCPSINSLMGEFHITADAAFYLLRTVYSHKINTLWEEKRHHDQLKDSDSNKECYVEACRTVNDEIVSLVRPHYSPRVWEELNPAFFVIFWTLQSNDLCVPKASYQRQMDTIKLQVAEFEKDGPELSTSKRKERDRLLTLLDRLIDEEKAREEHVNLCMARLEADKEIWFQTRSNKTDTVTQLLQLCIFPRVCFTSGDALYAAKFIHVLHKLKTPGFTTLICFDRIFSDITLCMTSCTENEAHRYGRFLCSLLDLIMMWHSSSDIYERECSNYPGFITVYRKGGDPNAKIDHLEFENYRHVVHKWHYRLTKAMVTSLDSGNFIQIRNTIIMLTRILPHYPKITVFGTAVQKRVEKLKDIEKDNRKDLHVLAVSYLAQLLQKSSTWVQETNFHKKPDPKASQTTSSIGQKASSFAVPNGNTKGARSHATVANRSAKSSSNSTEKSDSSGTAIKSVLKSKESSSDNKEKSQSTRDEKRRRIDPGLTTSPSKANRKGSSSPADKQTTEQTGRAVSRDSADSEQHHPRAKKRSAPVDDTSRSSSSERSVIAPTKISRKSDSTTSRKKRSPLSQPATKEDKGRSSSEKNTVASSISSNKK